MGKDKQSGTTVVNQTTTPTPTPEETELNKLLLQQQQAIQGPQTQLQQQAFGLGSQLLTGQALPGYLSGLPGGVAPEMLQAQSGIPLSAGTVSESAISDLSQKAIADLLPQFQAMGLPIESGVAASVAGRTAGDIRRSTYESNLERQLAIEEYNRNLELQRNQFNINSSLTTQYQNMNTLLNLLNLAVGGQAQIQQPVLQGQSQLSSNLAGLRSVNTVGTTQATQYNPFISGSGILSGIGTGIGVFGALGGFGGSSSSGVNNG